MFKLTQHLLRIPNYDVIFKSVTLELHTTSFVLAGHSKWANIKHTKGLKDGQRAMEFARITRTLRLAVQEGGSTNPDLNTPLRIAVEEALKRNMPNATIQGVLKKCDAKSAKLKKHLLEIRHGFKVFMVVVLYTDNLTMSKANIATMLKKTGSTYAGTIHMFFDKGILEVFGNDNFNAKTADELEEIATEHAIESGAEELEINDVDTKHLTFICDPVEIERVKQKLSALGYNVEGVEHVFIPNNPITLNEAEQDAYDKLKDKLRSLEGLDAIYDNINIEN